MRRLSLFLLLCASRAWAQPAPVDAPPADPTPVTPSTEQPPEGEPPTSSPLEPKTPEPPPAPKPLLAPIVIAPAPAPPSDDGFRFGSYGRVLAGSDLRGGKPERIAIVAHSPRIVEDSYLELDASYGFTTEQGLKVRPVLTLAFDGTLFHDTGEFDAHPALRNMFLDVEVTRELTAWAGSRMYRGDDIYLLDYWPLDDQNIVGAGVTFHRALDRRNTLELAAAGGLNRLNDPYQYQVIEVANPVQGETTVLQLNRQRAVASASASFLHDGGQAPSFKAKVHGELHELPSGTFKNDDGTFTALPSDSGYLIGAELSLYNLQPRKPRFRSHLNMFVRYAKGLAAFDELQPPTSLGPDRSVSRASEFTFGVAANFDHKLGNVMFGFLTRDFTDASGNASDFNNGWEYAADIRPLANIGKGFFAGADVSYQARFPNGLNNITLRAEDPAVFQIAPMIVLSPMGPSAYDRPELRIVYRAAHLNEGALDLYVPDDPRHDHAWVHFLGVEAEWWFNSTTYKR